MSFHYKRSVITPDELKSRFPMTEAGIQLKKERDAQICDIISGKSDKFLVIVGPCSADHEDAVMDYLIRLKQVANKVADKLFIVPRIYTNKPRTTGEGYKGMAHQPNPEGQPDLQEGIIAVRKMHLRAINETEMTAADEMLYPENWPYVEDMLSYVAVGARSVENQQHRLTVSGMNVAAGMKNPTSGDLSVMLNSCVAAQGSHTFLFRTSEVCTDGNPYAHCILRGAVNKHGQCIPNYHYEDLVRLYSMYQERVNLKNPAVIVDANHSNSNKQYFEQPRIVKEVLHSRKVNKDIGSFVKGVMIESYIENGCQSVHEHVYGKSITDPCLGFSETEQLIYEIAEKV